MDDWSLPDDFASFDPWSPLQREVLLKGSILVIVTGRDGRPRPGKKVIIRGCGFV